MISDDNDKGISDSVVITVKGMAAPHISFNNCITSLRSDSNDNLLAILFSDKLPLYSQTLSPEKSVPYEYKYIPHIRQKQKYFERVMEHFNKNFMALIEGRFLHTFYAFRKNSKRILVIKEDA